MEIPTAPEEDPIEVEIQEEKEDSEQQSYEKIKAHNNEVMANWHARCSIAGLLPKEFELLPEKEIIKKEINLENNEQNPEMEIYKNEIKIENKNEIKVDESVYDSEIKIEDKKSFMEPEIPKKKKKSHGKERGRKIEGKEERKTYLQQIQDWTSRHYKNYPGNISLCTNSFKCRQPC